MGIKYLRSTAALHYTALSVKPGQPCLSDQCVVLFLSASVIIDFFQPIDLSYIFINLSQHNKLAMMPLHMTRNRGLLLECTL
jgi:hypothetical protein